MMKKSLSHTVWDCKYHIVWVPDPFQNISVYSLCNILCNFLICARVESGVDSSFYSIINILYPKNDWRWIY